MNKEFLKSRIYAVETKVVGIIAAGVISRASKRETLRLVRDQIGRLSLSDAEKNELWLFAVSFYRHTVAAAQRETDVNTRIEKVYAVLRNDHPLLIGVKNTIADSVEFRYKHDEIRNIVTGDNIFYRCSSHEKCAAGHQAYQGKVFVIADWKRKVQDQEAVARVIDQEKILTVEEVTSGPVWLVTRRNCKHRLYPVPIEWVLKGRTGDLGSVIKTRNIGYAEQQYNAYRDRLKMFEKMRDAFKKYGEIPVQMKVDVKRTRRLAKDWKSEMDTVQVKK